MSNTSNPVNPEVNEQLGRLSEKVLNAYLEGQDVDVGAIFNQFPKHESQKVARVLTALAFLCDAASPDACSNDCEQPDDNEHRDIDDVPR